MLRIERTLLTLKAAMQQPVQAVDTVWVLEGDYGSYEVARSEAGESTQKLPWRFSNANSRYFFGFDYKLPEFEAGYQYYFEVSTGREGNWDAVNPQLLAYVNNQVICGLDVNHRTIYIDSKYQGTTIEVGCHLYTGMQGGDLAIRVNLVKRSVAVWDAYHDLRVIKDAIAAMPDGNGAKLVLQTQLLEAIQEVRFPSDTTQNWQGPCQALSKILHARCYGDQGQLPYTVHGVGHTHIDVAWLWDLRQTKEKVARSYATALDLQSRYPGYRFMASQPVLYEMLEAGQPEVFKGVQDASAKGIWESEGAMYLEADCNLAGGESLIRQIERGQAYFKAKFGRESRTLWLPDVFGYSAALPQILKGFGIELFITSKISWNDTNKLPSDSFMWQGLDGTEIPTQFITTVSMETLNKGEFKTIYEGNMTATEVLGSVMRHQQKAIQPHVIMPYGYGDGGGGATEEMLETAKRLVIGLPGMPKLQMSSVSDFVDAYSNTAPIKLPTWVGELYLEYHRGTYTTNGGIKQRHRKLEDQLLVAEIFEAVLAKPLKQWDHPWEMLLLNQFHDILPGTSVESVYTEAYQQLDHASAQVAQSLKRFIHGDQTQTNPVSIFNPSAQDFSGFVTFEATETVVAFESDLVASVPLQAIGNGQYRGYFSKVPALSVITGALVPTKAPSNGKLKEGEQPVQSVTSTNTIDFAAGKLEFETPFYQVTFDEQGQIIGLWDRHHHRSVLSESGFGNRLVAYEDRPLRWDAWDINLDYVNYPIEFDQSVTVKCLENGPIARVIGVEKTLGNSRVYQKIYFYQNSGRIDFETEVDWHQQQVLLRTEFDLNIHAPFATYDTQCGYVHRPTNHNHSYNEAMFEVCAAHWGDLSETDYGVMLMSNDKFGYSAKGQKLGLSLLKSPTWPNTLSDQGYHQFSYALLPLSGPVDYGNRHYQAMCYCQPPTVFDGLADAQKLHLATLPDHLTLESLRHLDGGELELRLVERGNKRGLLPINIGVSGKVISSAVLTDLKGDQLTVLNSTETGFEVPFKPFEIMTIRLRLHNS